jgi:hypothetical protein
LTICDKVASGKKKKRRETHNFPFPRCITATAAGSHSFCVLCRICSAP